MYSGFQNTLLFLSLLLDFRGPFNFPQDDYQPRNSSSKLVTRANWACNPTVDQESHVISSPVGSNAGTSDHPTLESEETQPDSQAKATSESKKKSLRLVNIPTELLLHIMNYCSKPGGAALALTCRTILWKTGDKWFRDVSADRNGYFNLKLELWAPQARYDLLKMLERDSADLLYCKDCMTLYNKNSPMNEGGKGRNFHTQCSDYGTIPIVSGLLSRCKPPVFRIKGSDMQRAALLINNCEDGGRYLQRVSATFLSESIWRRASTTTKARFVENSILFRTQCWTLIAPRLGKFSYGNKGKCDSFFRELDSQIFQEDRVCAHLSRYTTQLQLSSELEGIIMSFANGNREEEGFKFEAIVYRCSRCPTECQIDLQDFGAKGVALVLTVWKDYGCFKSTSCAKWRQHNPTIGVQKRDWKCCPVRRQRHATLPVQDCFDLLASTKSSWRRLPRTRRTPVSIRSRFEGSENYVFDSLSSMPIWLLGLMLQTEPIQNIPFTSCTCCYIPTKHFCISREYKITQALNYLPSYLLALSSFISLSSKAEFEFLCLSQQLRGELLRLLTIKQNYYHGTTGQYRGFRRAQSMKERVWSIRKELQRDKGNYLILPI